MVGDDFLNMVKDLQKKIEHEEEATYSKTVINEYRNPTNFGVLEQTDAVGEVKGSCGDTMKISLLIRDDVIKDARFWTDGCGASIACGNMLTKIIIGKTVREAKRITSLQLLEALGGLPVENQHCSVLAVNTLHKGLDINKNFI